MYLIHPVYRGELEDLEVLVVDDQGATKFRCGSGYEAIAWLEAERQDRFCVFDEFHLIVMLIGANLPPEETEGSAGMWEDPDGDIKARAFYRRMDHALLSKIMRGAGRLTRLVDYI